MAQRVITSYSIHYTKLYERLAAKMKELGLTVIFHEELTEPRIAEAVAGETGAKLLLLHGAHNLSKNELESGVTFP